MRPMVTGVGRVTRRRRFEARLAVRGGAVREAGGVGSGRGEHGGRQVFGFSFDCERYAVDIFFGCDCASPMRPGHMIKFNCDITCPVVLFPPFNRAMDDALSVLVRDMCFAVGRASRDAPGMQRARCVQCPRLLLAETAACSFTVTSTAARLFTPMGQPCGVCFIGRIVGGGARHGRVLIAARKGVGLLRGRFCPGAGPRGRQRDRTAEGQQPLHSARASAGSTLPGATGCGPPLAVVAAGGRQARGPGPAQAAAAATAAAPDGHWWRHRGQGSLTTEPKSEPKTCRGPEQASGAEGPTCPRSPSSARPPRSPPRNCPSPRRRRHHRHRPPSSLSRLKRLQGTAERNPGARRFAGPLLICSACCVCAAVCCVLCAVPGGWWLGLGN